MWIYLAFPALMLIGCTGESCLILSQGGMAEGPTSQPPPSVIFWFESLKCLQRRTLDSSGILKSS